MSGKKLIENMKNAKNSQYWTSTDLIDYVTKSSPENPRILYDNPQTREYCFNLEGTFSIDELEALVLMARNDRGQTRG